MAERIGVVLHTFDNGMAEVVTDRRNACGGCEKSHGCRSCLTSAKMVSTVQNPAGAGQGDVVSIYLKESALWTGAVFLYIVPILWLMAGAFVGASLGSNWEIGETGAAILMGLSGTRSWFFDGKGHLEVFELRPEDRSTDRPSRRTCKNERGTWSS